MRISTTRIRSRWGNRSTSLRGAKRRSNPVTSAASPLDGLLRGACHRARICATRWLAMTAASGLLQLVMNGIIGIAGFLAAIERRAVIGRQREAALQQPRQIRIGNEDAAERDRIGMARGDR